MRREFAEEAHIPLRRASSVQDYDDLSCSKRENSDDLTTIVRTDIEKETESESELSVCSFVLHEMSDGEYAAKYVCEQLMQDGYDAYDMDFAGNKNDPCPHVKKKSLIRVGKQNGYWEKQSPKEFTWGALAAIVTIIFTVLEFVFQNQAAVHVALAVIAVVSAIAFVIILIGMIKKSLKHRNESYEKLIQKLSETDDAAFYEFVDDLDASDYDIAKCNLLDKQICIVRNLGELNARRRYILCNYLLASEGGKRQYWLIFGEKNQVNLEFVKYASQCRVKRYYMHPLTVPEKYALAEKIQLPKGRFDLSILKRCGVDYIMSEMVRLKKESNLVDLADRIDRFCNGWTMRGFAVNTETLIYMIADLRCNFLNLDNTRNVAWQRLFDMSERDDSEIAQTDRRLCAELFFQQSEPDQYTQLTKLIAPVLDAFRDDMEDILICKQLRSRVLKGELYDKVLLIKAMRCGISVTEDRSLAISDRIWNIIRAEQTEDNPKWREMFYSNDWARIFLHAIELIECNGMYWYLPLLLRRFVEIYAALDVRKCKTVNLALFSSAQILQASATNVLLHMDTDETDNAFRLHYNIVKSACSEQGAKWDKNASKNYPKSLGLLQFTDAERLEYYHCLVALGAKKILTYYDSLFDMFCAAVGVNAFGQKLKLVSPDVAENDLYDKYARRIGKLSIDLPEYGKYAVYAIQDILSDIQKNCQGEFVPELVGKILACIAETNENRRTQNLLLLSARCDAYGSATLMFATAAISTLLTTGTLSQQVYLGIENKELRALFLLLYERDKSAFNDDIKYLIDILTEYEEPCNAVLGYMVVLSTYFLPQILQRRVRAFLQQYETRIFSAFRQIARTVRGGDVEAFIRTHYILFRQGFGEKTDWDPIWSMLQQHLDRDFASSPIRVMGNQVISVLKDGKMDESIVSCSMQEVVAQMSKYSPELVTILYGEYLEMDEKRFLGQFPALADKIWTSSNVSKYYLFMRFLNSDSDATECEYLTVLKMFLSELRSIQPNSIDILNGLFVCINRNRAHMQESEREDIWHRLTVRKEQCMRIESQQYFRQKVWGRYGILQYILFLISADIFHARETMELYARLDEKEKIEYYIQNAASMPPMLNKEDGWAYNSAYIDMLNAIIANTDDIQQKLQPAENNLLILFAENAEQIVRLTLSDSSVRKEIGQMLADYKTDIAKRERGFVY